MNSRLLSIIRKEFIQIFRDTRTLVMIIIIPIMQLFLLGYSATSDVRNIPLAVLDQSRSPESRALLNSYRAADYFRIAYDVQSEAEIEMLVSRGDARAAQAGVPSRARHEARRGVQQKVFHVGGRGADVDVQVGARAAGRQSSPVDHALHKKIQEAYDAHKAAQVPAETAQKTTHKRRKLSNNKLVR